MDFVPSISDFATEIDFVKLQNKFISYDERGIMLNDEEFLQVILKKDFHIIYKSYDINNEENYETVFFYKDFLLNKILKMGEKEINFLKKNMINNFLYKDSERKNFINHQISIYNGCFFEVNGSIFLNDSIKLMVIGQIQQVLEFLYNINVLKELFKTEEKMKIKMNRNDIQMLFFLLRQAKLIDHPVDADLGRLIDNFFLYYNKETNEYKEIRKSNKDLSDYKNYSKTVENSMERLKIIFSDEKFYNINI